MTVLETLFEIMKDYSYTPNTSMSSVSSRLSTWKNTILESNNNLPDSFDSALKLLEPFLMPLFTYHVCPNDCILFRNEHEYATSCPVCGENRYKADGKTALRNFTYFPITPRIRRMIATEKMCLLLNEHKYKQRQDFIQQDKHDSKVWTEDWFGEDGLFKEIDYGIVMSICLDGVNPFTQNHVDYSMWPIELSIDNFPQEIRKTCAGIWLAGIIPGKGSK